MRTPLRRSRLLIAGRRKIVRRLCENNIRKVRALNDFADRREVGMAPRLDAKQLDRGDVVVPVDGHLPEVVADIILDAPKHTLVVLYHESDFRLPIVAFGQAECGDPRCRPRQKPGQTHRSKIVINQVQQSLGAVEIADDPEFATMWTVAIDLDAKTETNAPAAIAELAPHLVHVGRRDPGKTCVEQIARQRFGFRPLIAIPNVLFRVCADFFGSIGSSMLSMKAPPPETFRSGRDFAAWLGLTPKDHSTGGRQRLGGIIKAGGSILRSTLIVGATALLRHVRKVTAPSDEAMKLQRAAGGWFAPDFGPRRQRGRRAHGGLKLESDATAVNLWINARCAYPLGGAFEQRLACAKPSWPRVRNRTPRRRP